MLIMLNLTHELTALLPLSVLMSVRRVQMLLKALRGQTGLQLIVPPPSEQGGTHERRSFEIGAGGVGN
jgi:hypothetical protein